MHKSFALDQAFFQDKAFKSLTRNEPVALLIQTNDLRDVLVTPSSTEGLGGRRLWPVEVHSLLQKLLKFFLDRQGSGRDANSALQIYTLAANSQLSLPVVQICPTSVGRQNYTIYIRQELTGLYPIVISWVGG